MAETLRSRLGIVLALGGVAALVGCSGGSTLALTPQPASSTVVKPVQAPFPVTVTVRAHRVEDAEVGRYGPCCKIAPHSGVYDITIAMANSSAAAVPIPLKDAVLFYGPDRTRAQSEMTNANQATVVPAHGSTSIGARFVIPDALVKSAVLVGPFPKYDGTDSGAEMQETIVKSTS